MNKFRHITFFIFGFFVFHFAAAQNTRTEARSSTAAYLEGYSETIQDYLFKALNSQDGNTANLVKGLLSEYTQLQSGNFSLQGLQNSRVFSLMNYNGQLSNSPYANMLTETLQKVGIPVSQLANFKPRANTSTNSKILDVYNRRQNNESVFSNLQPQELSAATYSDLDQDQIKDLLSIYTGSNSATGNQYNLVANLISGTTNSSGVWQLVNKMLVGSPLQAMFLTTNSNGLASSGNILESNTIVSLVQDQLSANALGAILPEQMTVLLSKIKKVLNTESNTQ